MTALVDWVIQQLCYAVHGLVDELTLRCGTSCTQFRILPLEVDWVASCIWLLLHAVASCIWPQLSIPTNFNPGLVSVFGFLILQYWLLAFASSPLQSPWLSPRFVSLSISFWYRHLLTLQVVGCSLQAAAAEWLLWCWTSTLVAFVCCRYEWVGSC